MFLTRQPTLRLRGPRPGCLPRILRFQSSGINRPMADFHLPEPSARSGRSSRMATPVSIPPPQCSRLAAHTPTRNSDRQQLQQILEELQRLRQDVETLKQVIAESASPSVAQAVVPVASPALSVRSCKSVHSVAPSPALSVRSRKSVHSVAPTPRVAQSPAPSKTPSKVPSPTKTPLKLMSPEFEPPAGVIPEPTPQLWAPRVKSYRLCNASMAPASQRSRRRA